MKRTLIALSALAIMAVIGVSSLQAQTLLEPSKVTGGGAFYNTGWDENNPPLWPPPDATTYEAVQFELNVQPASSKETGNAKAGKVTTHEKPAKAVIRMDSPSLRAFLGGKPLELRGEPIDYLVVGVFLQDPKPDQECQFLLTELGEVTSDWLAAKYLVGVGFNDNGTPGYSADMSRADWIWVWFLDLAAESEEEGLVFMQAGMLFKGNIMDHRK